MLLSALLLQTMVSFNPAIMYYVLGIAVIVLTGLAFVFNLKNEIQIVRNDIQNLKNDVVKLEQKTAADYNKIEAKIGLLEEKIEQLPVNITNLIKNFLKS